MVMSDRLSKLVAHLEHSIELPTVHLGPEHDYASLPLCVIDAVYSIGVNYIGTRNTVLKWCEFAGWPRLLSDGGPEHTISQVMEMISTSSDEDLADDVFRNRQRTSTRNGILKSRAVRKFAEVLQWGNVERFSDIRSDEAVERVEPGIMKITGQSSGISFDYFMILVGSDEYIKADRMICRFVADALGQTAISPSEAKRLFLDAATELKCEHPNVTPRALDHAVWNFQRAKEQTMRATHNCRQQS